MRSSRTYAWVVECVRHDVDFILLYATIFISETKFLIGLQLSMI